LSIAAALFALALTAGYAREPVLLDARCNELAWTRAERTPIGEGVTLLAMADRRYVYLCVTLPPESLGTLDLYIQGETGAPVNLHISAQTGERTRGENGWREWSGFNNYDGWYGPPVAFSGMIEGADGVRRPQFANSQARELQISRDRFGDGPWRVMLQVHALGTARSGGVAYPADGDSNDSSTWTSLAFR